MKSAREWVTFLTTEPMSESEAVLGIRVSLADIEAIQKDAFDTGRAQEMNSVSGVLEERMPKLAKALRAQALRITKPNNIPCSKNTP